MPLPLRLAFVATLDLLLPPRCLACLAPAWGRGPTPLCLSCAARIPAPQLRCPRCARPVGPFEAERGSFKAEHGSFKAEHWPSKTAHWPSKTEHWPSKTEHSHSRTEQGRFEAETTGGCPACLGETGVRDALWAPSRGVRTPVAAAVAGHAYTGTPRALVLGLKFGGRLRAARPLGMALAERLAAAGIPGDVLVPVPLSRARRRERGYDQARCLGRVVARALGLPLEPRALVKRRHTPPQTTLSRAGRQRAARGAFAGRRLIAGRAVILIDDVLTTGATARAAALALRRAGAVRVVVGAACRA